MRRIRVIPVLLLRKGGLYKTLRFKDPKYVGDPINTVKILSEKEADELILLDIGASAERQPPQFSRISQIVSEAFVPLAYGGGLRTLEDCKRVLGSGVEKVVLNTAAAQDPRLITAAAGVFGSQSVVVSIDVKRGWFGRDAVYIEGGRTRTSLDTVAWARRAEACGAGEILINSVDRDGTFAGYDVQLIRRVATAVKIPVVACGGARSLSDFVAAVTDGRASAVAAGSMFVFQGSRAGVLVSFPAEAALKSGFWSKLTPGQ